MPPHCALGILALSLLGSACVAQRVVAPRGFGGATNPRAKMADMNLEVCGLSVSGRSQADPPWSVRELSRSFRAYIERHAAFAEVRDCEAVGDASSSAHSSPFADPSLDLVRLTPRLDLSTDTSRTYLFEALWVYPSFGLLPFLPEWGRATVKTEVDITVREEKLAPIEFETIGAFSAIWYGFLRTDHVENAFRSDYDVAFKEVARRLVTRLERWRQARLAAAQSTVSGGTAPSTSTGTSTNTASRNATSTGSAARTSTATSASADTQSLANTAELEPKTIYIPEEGFRVLTVPVRREGEASLLLQSLRGLGGVEVGFTRGRASVSSTTRTETGSQTVASGRASTSGYRISLFRPPEVTGFYFPPRFGFFSQDIVLSGFREDLSDLNGGLGRGDIPARVTDPSRGGEEVDINEPIAYALRLRSGYLGPGIGLHLVLGTDDVRIFSTLEASVNALEIRHADVQIHHTRVSGYQVGFFQSGIFSAQAGITIVPAHLALRASMEFEWFRKFQFSQPVEFQALATFNPDKQIYERERVFVDAASVLDLHTHISAVILF